MKRTLSLVLVLAMLATAFVTALVFVSAEGTDNSPAVTVNVLDGSVKVPESDALAKLADGNRALDATAFSDAGLVAFENTGFTHTDGVDAAVEATFEIVVDLGETKTIGKVSLDAFLDSNSMVALPTAVKFSVSVDGECYYDINAGGTVAIAGEELATATMTADFSTRIAVNARYVKAVVTYKNGWVFLAEVSVTASDYTGEDPGSYAYSEHTVPSPGIGVFTSEDGELDLSASADGRLFQNSQLIKAVYDESVAAYKIEYSKVNPWPDGHTGTLTLAENEILVAISTGGSVTSDAFSGAKWLARGLSEGDYLTLADGIITFHTNDHFVYYASENIAFGKGWSGDTEIDAGYVGDLTDGVIDEAGHYDTSIWYGWDQRKAEDGVATAIIDLGEVRDSITRIAAHVWPLGASGISVPGEIAISVSTDGENYEKAGTITSFDGTAPQWVGVDFTSYMSARYVKYDISGATSGVFWFASELAVYADVAGQAPVEAPPLTIGIDNVGYVHGGTVSLVAGGGQTVLEITERGHGEAKDMNYAIVAVVDRDDRVVGLYTGVGVSKADVVCPEGGYMISYNCNKEGYAIMHGIQLGATITLNNISTSDMAFARTQTGVRTLTDAYFTVDNSTAYDGIEVSHVNAYQWESNYNTVVYGEGTGCADISSIENSDYNANWLAVKVENVDGVYTVTGIEKAGEEKVMTAPADGFILYCAQNALAKPGYLIANTLKVGDTLVSANFDWKATIGSPTPLGTLVFAPAAETPAADADGDGSLSARDGTAMLQYLAEVAEIAEGVSEDTLDLDGNGAFDIYDCVLMQQYLAGMITEFPAE